MTLQKFSELVLKVFGHATDFEDVTDRSPVYYPDDFTCWETHLRASVEVAGGPVEVHAYYLGGCITWTGKDDWYGFRKHNAIQRDDTETALRTLHCMLHFGYSQSKILHLPDGSTLGPIWGTSHEDLRAEIT
ncbi:hypothetical protein KKH39_01780 [Patescibacteria group bacterium]|nr:hypothetical protein [Patescibacteria group bacterium]